MVYDARHEQTGVRVALKVVQTPSADQVAAIRREIAVLRRLKHPGVVELLDAGILDGRPWYAMPMIEGRSLRQCLESGEVDRGSGLTLLRWMSVALAYVHGQGLLHRDLKPENVMIGREGAPVLVDYGLAELGVLSRATLNVSDEMRGTPDYMAPEILRGEPVDARADVYALGCILYEILTGKPPHLTGDRASMLRARLLRDPPPPSALGGGSTPELDALVGQMLRAEPTQRIGHAEVVASRLAELGAEGPPSAWRSGRGICLFRPRLTGRRSPLSVLEGRLEEAASGRGGLVLVSGESGIGKTRLMSEFASLAASRGRLVLGGACELTTGRSGELGGASLGAWREPLRRVGDICRERGARERERVLGGRVRLLTPFEPSLCDLVADESEPGDLPPQEARRRLFEGLLGVIRALAERRKLVVMLDDLQWGDELSLAFLEYLVQEDRLAGDRVLVVGTFRTEERNAELDRLAQADGVTGVVLERLGRTDVERLTADALALPEPPDTLVDRLFEHTEGNPFYLSEYLSRIVEEGMLQLEPSGRFSVVEARARDEEDRSWGIPRDLRGLLLRRLEALPPECRRVVDLSAVAGDQGDHDLLQGATECSEDQLVAVLGELQRRGILVASGPSLHAFSHHKLREVAYDLLGGEHRRLVHERVASGLEGRDPTPHAALARHWEQAGHPRKAASEYLEAAREAARQLAYQEAERCYRAFLRLEPPETDDAIRGQGELADHLRKHGGSAVEAAAILEDAIGRCRNEGDGAVLTVKLGAALIQLARRDEAQPCFERALEWFRARDRTDDQARCLIFLSIILLQRGDSAQAVPLLGEAVDKARAGGNPGTELVAIGNLGNVHYREGRRDLAAEHYQRALALAEAVGGLHHQVNLLGNLGVLALDGGKLTEARQLLTRQIEKARALGDRRQESEGLMNLAQVVHQAGEGEKARALLAQALELTRQTGHRRHEGIVLAAWAYTEQFIGDLDRARRLAEDALRVHEETGDLSGPIGALSTLAQVARRKGELATAQEHLDTAAGLLSRRETPSPTSYLTARVELELWSGRPEEARRWLEDLKKRFEEQGNLWGLAETVALEGHLTLSQGGSAAELLEELSRLIARCDAGPNSGLAGSHRQLKAAQEAFERGEPLEAGHCL